MSRKHRAGRAPDTPATSKDDNNSKSGLSDFDVPDSDETPTGRRFSDNDEILRLERKMVAEGVDLDNRAIPMKDHPKHHEYETAAEIRDEIASEASKEYPNRNRIGVLNEILTTL